VPTLAELIGVLDGWYPPSTAESWDSVGLTCGEQAASVDRVVLAVDCVPATVQQAIAREAQLLLTHHPLLLSGVHSVAAASPKGALVHSMIRHGVAHFAAHTNADIADQGVSHALADRLGLVEVEPLDPDPAPSIDHLSVFVPPQHLAAVLDALVTAGAGAIGNYDQCTFTVDGIGTFRPLDGADPADGEIGVLRRQPESRLSMVLPRSRRADVIAAMRAAHPYEEVAFELTEQPRLSGSTGTGRIGRLAQRLTLAEFTRLVATQLPSTRWGVRAAGDPEQSVSRIAVCGGSGGSYIELARSRGADAFLTADLRHHTASEAVDERQDSPMALVDAAHWATEQPWLEVLARRLKAHFEGLTVLVSDVVTDPWTVHEH